MGSEQRLHLLSYEDLANGDTEGDDTGYGQALYPVPADDPNDPLQVCPRLPTSALELPS